MKKHILYLSFLASVFFTACDLDSFSQVVEFEIPDEKPRLSVNCEYVNNTDSIQVFVSKSWNTNKDINSTLVNNAIVELWDDAQKIVTVPYRLEQKYYGQNGQATVGSQSYYSIKVPKSLDADKIYTLKVSAPGLESVEAKCGMPKLIKINKATYTKKGFKPKNSGGFGGGGGIANNIDLIAVEFDDVPNETNYYVLKMVKTLKDTVTNKIYYSQDAFRINQTFSSAATNIFDEGDYVYGGNFNFTDEIFDGKKFVFRIGVDNDNSFSYNLTDKDGNYASISWTEIEKLKIEGYDITLYNQSKERYYFANSLNTFYENDGNPFGEPIPLYTNFDKGFGLFSLFEVSNVYVKKK